MRITVKSAVVGADAAVTFSDLKPQQSYNVVITYSDGRRQSYPSHGSDALGNLDLVHPLLLGGDVNYDVVLAKAEANLDDTMTPVLVDEKSRAAVEALAAAKDQADADAAARAAKAAEAVKAAARAAELRAAADVAQADADAAAKDAEDKAKDVAQAEQAVEAVEVR